MKVPNVDGYSSTQLREWTCNVGALSRRISDQASQVSGLGSSVGCKGPTTSFRSPGATRLGAKVVNVDGDVRAAGGRLFGLSAELSSLAKLLGDAAQEAELKERAEAEREKAVRDKAARDRAATQPCTPNNYPAARP